MTEDEKTQGFISLHRKIRSCSLWDNNEPFDRRSAWVDLLLQARWKDGHIIIKGNAYELKRGECLISQATLAQRWGWSRNKVRKFLEMLQNMDMIRASGRANIGAKISICNYDTYQETAPSKGQQKDSRRTGEGQEKDRQRYEKNKDNKDNKENKCVQHADASLLESYWKPQSPNEPVTYNAFRAMILDSGEWTKEIVERQIEVIYNTFRGCPPHLLRDGLKKLKQKHGNRLEPFEAPVYAIQKALREATTPKARG